MKPESDTYVPFMSFVAVFAIAVLLCGAWLASAHAAAKDEKAEWVTRCDRVKEEARFDCLDKLRAAARTRYLERPEAREDAATAPKQNAPADANGKKP